MTFTKMKWIKKKNDWYFKPMEIDIGYFCALLVENTIDKLIYRWACTKYLNRVSAKQMEKMEADIKQAILEIPKLVK